MVTKVKKFNKLAIIGFILSFIAPFAIVGVGLCIYALTQIKKKDQRGRGLAIAGIIIGSIAFIVFLTSPEDFFSSEYNEKNIKTSSEDSKLYREEVMDLLPPNKEIDTEWEIGEMMEKNISEPGFVSGAYIGITKADSISYASGEIFVYKFINISSAESYYDERVEEVKRPYEEISFDLSGSECFAKKSDYVTDKDRKIICRNKNIVYISGTIGNDIYNLDYNEDMAEKINEKID